MNLTRQDNRAKLFKDVISGVVFSSIIIFVTLFAPVLGFFMAVILPMPVLYYRLKLGRLPGIIIASGVLLVTVMVIGGLSIDILFYAALIMIGLVLGESLEQHLSIEKSLFFTVFSTVFLSAFLFFIYAGSAGSSVLEMVTSYVAANLKLTLSIYQDIGIPQENIELIDRSIDTIKYVLVRLVPALMITMLTFITWINILFIKRILNRKGIYLKTLENLNRWKAPEKLVWSAIICGVLLMLPWTGVKIAALNCILILMPVYFFQGIAIMSFIFEKKGFPPVLRLFIYTIIAIQQIFILLIVGIGFFDTWLNFRKIEVMTDHE
ncbi:conserved membrane hypothetical protein [Desulfamplus magnetovallimortis]|uniref:DUF2232 domain-containing protein n=1 Tax=Desulfamplus magnetovallimortis TaxID=1246637 RepID=A0A1W1HIC1_9BACT|nr:DUF2232 domain-containing protein [Desulfamplus magnetovallimortis]SLM32165.1 conserved membrane hypothetical protein [Desulfamplus magnetovallimortis]